MTVCDIGKGLNLVKKCDIFFAWTVGWEECTVPEVTYILCRVVHEMFTPSFNQFLNDRLHVLIDRCEHIAITAETLVGTTRAVDYRFLSLPLPLSSHCHHYCVIVRVVV